MDPTVKAAIFSRFEYLQENSPSVVIDADTHPTDIESVDQKVVRAWQAGADYYHGKPMSAEDLIWEMDQSDVSMALIWQNPATTVYSENPGENYTALLKANKAISAMGIKNPLRFIPAGWTDPKALGIEHAIKLAQFCVEELGFPIVKMNPAQNAYPIDSDMVLSVVKAISELGAIPAFHFGADTGFTPAEGLQVVAESVPDTPVIAVHMGGGGAAYPQAEDMYQKARKLGLTHGNIHYVLSAKRDSHIESDLITYQSAGESFAKRIHCASDAPYGKLSWNFGGFRQMFKTLREGHGHPDVRLRDNPHLFSESAFQGFLGTNFAELILPCYQKLLEQK